MDFMLDDETTQMQATKIDVLALEPEQPAVGAEAVLALRVTNRGLSAWNEGEARVAFDGIGFPTTRELALPALAASETLQVRVPFTATTAGRGEVVARVQIGRAHV